MKIKKVLNNSLILAEDEHHQEIILMGKGIGYHKSIGYELQKAEIQKVFVLRDQKVNQDILKLAKETDAVYFELTKSIVDYAITQYHMDVMDHIYLSLTDHIAFALKRVKEGIILNNFYVQEIRIFNPNEYQVGLYALSLINEKLNVALPEDEAGNIAFHFINGQKKQPNYQDNENIRKFVTSILSIVKYHFTLFIDEQSLSYQRFLTHLHFLAQRVFHHHQDYSMKNYKFADVEAQYPQAYSCTKKICKYIYEHWNAELTDDEIAYLTIHIQNLKKSIEVKGGTKNEL